MTHRIAIYLTNTDRGALNNQFPNYAEMTETLLSSRLPNTTFEHFDVTNGVFPEDPTTFDGVVLTGSAANVSDEFPWMETLCNHIRKLDAARIKLLGICFGHQAIVAALGGQVCARDINLGAPPIAVDTKRPWMTPEADELRLFAGNFQQVAALPEGMTRLAGSKACPFAMIEKDNHILSLQYHPEFSVDYMRGYISKVETKVPADVVSTALTQLETGHDGAVFGQWAAQFFTA